MKEIKEIFLLIVKAIGLLQSDEINLRQKYGIILTIGIISFAATAMLFIGKDRILSMIILNNKITSILVCLLVFFTILLGILIVFGVFLEINYGETILKNYKLIAVDFPSYAPFTSAFIGVFIMILVYCSTDVIGK